MESVRGGGNPFRDFKTWQPYPTVNKKLTSQNLTRFFKQSEKESAECTAFQRFVKAEIIHQNSGSFQDLFHFNQAAYYLTVWFGNKTLLKTFSSPFTVIWLNKSHTIWIVLDKSIAATAKLRLAIKTRDCKFMTGNYLPESESMRTVLGSLNLQMNRKIPQIMYIY